MNAENITLIYALRDTGFIKYVGKTCKALEWRLADHLKAARDGDPTHRGRGIRKMLQEGHTPTITLITVAKGSGDKEEIAWIAYFRSYGIKLWNMTRGGDGVMAGRRHTEATKKKIGLSRKGQKLSEETRERMRHRIFTKEEIAKRTATRKARGYKPSEETKRKIGLANKGRFVSEETRQKLSAVSRGFTDEDRRKAIATIKSRPFSPEHRRKISESMKRINAFRKENKINETVA
jgi:hypothetical protein